MSSPRNENSPMDAMMMLADAMGGGSTGDAILAQEARGQRQLVGGDVLPTDISPADKEALEAAGVVFGAAVDGDPVFQNAQLPEGWQKVATDHSMWSDLVDGNGVKRASIFYKAAFYDRSAHLNLVRG